MSLKTELRAKIDRSLRACIKEGVLAQIIVIIFDYYLVPFALFLGASLQEIGFLVSVPHLLASGSQFFVVQAVQIAGSRINLLNKGLLIQSLLMLPIPFLLFVNVPGKIFWLIVLVTIFRILGNILGPAWGSIVSNYLPENKRGAFFGKRSQIIGIFGIAAMILCGMSLSALKSVSEQLAFFVIFLIAAVSRFAGLFYMSQMIELPYVQKKEDEFTFWMFIRRFRESNFVKFIFYVASITFATQLSSAYFSVYMLKELNFSYAAYMAVHLSSLVMGLLSFPVWGRHADKIGNAKIIKLTSALVPLIPIFWIFARHPVQLVTIEMFSGFIWGGFNLCATNFIYDAVSPPKRVRCLGYYNLINGVAIFGGASLGGFLSQKLPPLMGSSLISIFLISAVLRMLAYLILAEKFREVRPSLHKVRSFNLFMSVLGVRPMSGRNNEAGGILPPIPRWRPTIKASSTVG